MSAALIEVTDSARAILDSSDSACQAPNRTGNLSWPKAKLSQCMKPAEDAHTVEADKQYPNLGIYSFGRGLFRKQPIDGALTSATTLYRIKSGQFIYSRLFAFEGAYGAVADEFDGYFVSGEYPTFDCDPVYTTAEFLAAMFQSPDIWKSVAQRSKGLGDHRQRVKVEQLLDFEIPLPPLDWQAKIVKLGHRIAAAKHLQEATALGLDAFLPAIFDQAFRGAS